VQKSPAAADIDVVIRYKKETKWMNKKKSPTRVMLPQIFMP